MVDFFSFMLYFKLMESHNKISFLANNSNKVNRSSNLLDKAFGSLTTSVITIGIILGGCYFGYKVIQKIPNYIKVYKIKDLNFYTATGGKTIQSHMVGMYYDSPNSKRIEKIELANRDEPLYLFSPGIPYKDFTQEKINERSALLNEIFNNSKFLEIALTSYENKATGHKIDLIISAKEIDAIEVNMDMDEHQTIFRHPQTYKIIPKEDYDFIISEMKKEEEFKDSVNTLLESAPVEFSKYSLRFMEEGFIEDYKMLANSNNSSSNSLNEATAKTDNLKYAISVVEPLKTISKDKDLIITETQTLITPTDNEFKKDVELIIPKEREVIEQKYMETYNNITIPLEKFTKWKNIPVIEQKLNRIEYKVTRIGVLKDGYKPFLPVIPKINKNLETIKKKS